MRNSFFAVKKIRKRILAVAAAACLLLFTLGGCSDYRGDSKQVIDHIKIDAELAENGDMTIRETWKINLEDRDRDYRNLYRTFELDSSKADGITDFSVYDEDDKVSYHFIGDFDPESGELAPDYSSYTHQTGNLFEVGWFMPAIREGVRTFIITYTVKNIVAVHQDTAVLYHFFNPRNFSLPITEMDGTIQFPSGGEQSAIRAYLHSTAKGNLTIDSADKISFTVHEIPAKTSVEVRLCTPPHLFPASTRTDTQTVLPSITAEEQKWAEDYRAEQQRQYLLGIIDAVGGVVLFLAGIALFILIKHKNRRHSVDVPEYTREIPPGNSPGGIANLFYFYSGGITKKVEGRVFSATLLSLARKGFITFEGQREKDFAVRITGKTKNTALTESEQVFYNMISTVAEHFNGSFTMKQFRNFAETDFKYVNDHINSFLASTKREISTRGYYESKPAYLYVSIGVGIASLVLSFIVLALSGAVNSTLVYIPLSLILFGVLLILAGSSKQKLTVKGEQDLGLWNGLKKYMLEFSRMKEYSVPQLPLWEEYLVYATMMGISKQVCSQLKMVYPELNDETYLNTYWGNSYLYYMFGHPMGPYGYRSSSDDFGASLASTISDISNAATRLANPPPSNNSGFGGGGFGGGSFGGGGGGFSSGGGGGVR
ncbi:DUF2207 family protein [Caproiciproducens sp. LBM24188]